MTDEEKAAAAKAEAGAKAAGDAKAKADAEAAKRRSSDGAVLDEQQSLKRRVRRVEEELGLDELLAGDDAPGSSELDPDTFEGDPPRESDLLDDLVGYDAGDELDEGEAA